MLHVTYLYTLEDPADGIIRYVGRTDEPANRLKNHINEGRSYPTSFKNRWVSELRSRGRIPSLKIRKCIPHKDSRIIEQQQIRAYSRIYPLLNGEIRNPHLLKKSELAEAIHQYFSVVYQWPENDQPILETRSFAISQNEYRDLILNRLPYETDDNVITAASGLIMHALKRLPPKK